jgi:hypothetical protein
LSQMVFTSLLFAPCRQRSRRDRDLAEANDSTIVGTVAE